MLAQGNRSRIKGLLFSAV